MLRTRSSLVLPGLLLAGLVACTAETNAGAANTAAEPGATAAPAGPTAADRDFEAITANWSPRAVETCGPNLREALGTRDLVQGAYDGVEDPDSKATVELEDARHWIDLGNAKIEEVRPQLQAGTCDGSTQVALDEAVQFYVKAGTSAVQAGQIAGS